MAKILKEGTISKCFQGNTHRVCCPPKTAKTSRNYPLGLTFIKLLAGNNVKVFSLIVKGK